MIEILRHTLGICGEHWHPTIFTVLAGGLGLGHSIQYLRLKYMKIK